MRNLPITHGMVINGRVHLDVFPWELIKDRDGLVMQITIELPGSDSRMATEIIINIHRCDGLVRLDGMYLTITKMWEWERSKGNWYLILEVD